MLHKKRLGLFIPVFLMFLMAVVMFGFHTLQAHAVNNGLALTPPMGWNNYNHFGCNVGASVLEQQADAMVSSGLAAAGYQYINIDDCWSTKSRASNGAMVPDPNKYPNGITAVANYVHSKGLKLGLYTDAGTATCSGYPGMYGHEQQDANSFASWGIDYLKVDWCSSTGIDAQTEYTKIGNALRSSGRSITYSLCDWGQSSVWNWGPGVGNLWRTTGDISDNWTSMLSNFDSSAAHASSAAPGGWNDPDMLEVGNGGMSTTEDQTHFSLWAISAAPLILGNDMTNMSASAKSILMNADVIAVDQDPRGVQGTKVSDSNGLQVWSKPLQGNGNVAVVLLNRNTSASNITVNWSNIGISGSASVRDLWSHSNVGSFNGSYTANVAGHGVVMLKISTGGSGGPTPTPTPVITPTPKVTPTPGVTPTPANTPTPTPTPVSGNGTCKVSYSVNQWQGGFTANITITNTGTSTLNGWALKFTFPGNQQVTQAWSGIAAQSGANVTLTNASYNATLAAGSSVNPGFNGSWSGSNPNPTAFTLNGTACSIA
ncbi:MAG: cellulose binding domain-containing protein [Ktedonobacteraceae bacterium]|nr:cellulose binding domain-containing protein [Ktedonobacteraceae bacterium]